MNPSTDRAETPRRPVPDKAPVDLVGFRSGLHRLPAVSVEKVAPAPAVAPDPPDRQDTRDRQRRSRA